MGRHGDCRSLALTFAAAIVIRAVRLEQPHVEQPRQELPAPGDARPAPPPPLRGAVATPSDEPTRSTPAMASLAVPFPPAFQAGGVAQETVVNPAAFRAALLEYAALHTQEVARAERGEPGARLLMVWNYGGTGNRLLPALTGFLLGLVSRRAVLANWRESRHSTKLSELFDLAPFNWAIPEHPEIARSYSESRCTRERADVFHIPEASATFAPHRDRFVCADLVSDDVAFGGRPTVSMVTNQYLAPLLLQNPSVRRRLAEIGLNPDGDVAGVLFYTLARLSPAMVQRVEGVRAQLFDELGAVVGLHSRLASFAISADVEGVMRSAPRCVRQRMQTLDAALLAPAPPTLSAGARVGAFVATDSEAGASRLLAGIGDGARRAPVPVSEYANEDAQHYAVQEVFLLASCDVLITQFMSTFSYMARTLHAFYGARRHASARDAAQLAARWRVLDGSDCTPLHPLAQPCLHVADQHPEFQVHHAACVVEAQRQSPAPVHELVRLSGIEVPGQHC